MKKFFVLFIVIIPIQLSSIILYAQDRQPDSHFSGSAAAGMSWSGQDTWSFETCDCAPIQPGVSLAVGMEYGPILNLEGALFYSSIEIAYGEEHASKNYPEGTIEGAIQQMPIILWTKVLAESRLSPFLRAGAGIVKSDFRETTVAKMGPTIRFHQWHFLWGFGGGLNYMMNDKLSLELFFDEWGIEKNIIGTNSEGYNDGIYARYYLINYGIRGILEL